MDRRTGPGKVPGNRPGPIGVLQYVYDVASINLCLTTSRLIWLAVLVAFASAIRLLRESSWNTSTRWSSALSGPISPAGFLKKTLPRKFL